MTIFFAGITKKLLSQQNIFFLVWMDCKTINKYLRVCTGPIPLQDQITAT